MISPRILLTAQKEQKQSMQLKQRRGSFSSGSLDDGSDESLKDSDDSFGVKKKRSNSFEEDFDLVISKPNGRSFGRSGSFKVDEAAIDQAGSPEQFRVQ